MHDISASNVIRMAQSCLDHVLLVAVFLSALHRPGPGLTVSVVNVGRLETLPLTALGGPTSPKHGSPKPATGLDRVTVS
jgi:hypothetical protein